MIFLMAVKYARKISGHELVSEKFKKIKNKQKDPGWGSEYFLEWGSQQ